MLNTIPYSGRRGRNVQEPLRSPLAASAEDPRLAVVPGLQNASGESLVAVATGHPRRPVLRMFGSMAAALIALREMRGGKEA